MPKSILVADFDITRRYVIARVLRAAGYDVVEANDAEAADLALAERHFALVFVAMRLSGGDGFDLCRVWSARGLRVVLVASDFRESELLRARAAEAGAQGILSSAGDREHVLGLTQRLFAPSAASG